MQPWRLYSITGRLGGLGSIWIVGGWSIWTQASYSSLAGYGHPHWQILIALWNHKSLALGKNNFLMFERVATLYMLQVWRSVSEIWHLLCVSSNFYMGEMYMYMYLLTWSFGGSKCVMKQTLFNLIHCIQLPHPHQQWARWKFFITRACTLYMYVAGCCEKISSQ